MQLLQKKFLFRRAVAVLVMLSLVFMLTGCDLIFSGSIKQAPTPSGVPDSVLTPIDPNPSSGREQAVVTLYYRYQQESMLAPDARQIAVPAGERVETAAIRELLRGPSGEKTELTELFPPGTQVLSVTEGQDCLFVTLSKEMLDLPQDVPQDWQEQPVWRESVNVRRRLGLYAIVNTVTGMGLYSRVQILVDMGDGQGERIRRNQAGFAGEVGDSQLLEPLGLKHDVILTPRNTVQEAMRAAESKNWELLYGYLSSQADANAKNYTLEEFISWGSGWPGSLSFYQVHDELISYDGKTALVTLDMRMTLKDGTRAEKMNVQLRLVQENGLWKVYYPSMLSLFT